jgi:glutamate/tyrosine decarboxylase-like PLP-dependent enzyme
MCHGVAPLPLLADRRGATGSCTAGASRSRLLAFRAASDHALVRMGCVSQPHGHDNRKQRYSKSLQHTFFLPEGRQMRQEL